MNRRGHPACTIGILSAGQQFGCLLSFIAWNLGAMRANVTRKGLRGKIMSTSARNWARSAFMFVACFCVLKPGAQQLTSSPAGMTMTV